MRRRFSTKHTLVAALGAVVLATLLVLWPARTDAPVLTSDYRMAFHNLTSDTTSDGTLSKMTVDPDGNVIGAMTVNLPLFGTGPLEGSLDGRSLAFALGGGAAYEGEIDSDGAITGTYIYPRQEGRWRAEPVDRQVSRSGLPRWLWFVVAGLSGFAIASVARSGQEVGRHDTRS